MFSEHLFIRVHLDGCFCDSIIYHFYGFFQTIITVISSKPLFRSTPRAIKLGTKSVWKQIVNAMDRSYPVSKKELFLKLAVPKKQTKLLELFEVTLVFIAFVSCRARTFNSLITISKEFSKVCLPPLSM